MKYFYPIVLKNKKLHVFKVAHNIELRKLIRQEREEFFGLRKIDYGFSQKFPLGFIALHKTVASLKQKGRYSHLDIIKRGIYDGTSDILAADYVLVIECEGSPDFIIDDINLSFLLVRPTSTGAYLGFRDGGTDVHIGHLVPVHGPFDYLNLRGYDLKCICNFYSLILSKKNDNKLKLYADLYRRALQGGRLELDLRFILLVVCLEAMYLPDQNTELKLRLSLRIANLLARNKNGRSKDIYLLFRNIYDIRSELMHRGKTTKLNGELFYKLAEIVRLSIRLYIEHDNYFSEEYLNNINLF